MANSSFGFLGASQLLQQLREQVVRGAVVGVVFDGPPEHAFGGGRLLLLHVGAAEQDVRPAVERVQPQRPLQRGDRLVAAILAQQRVAELIGRHRIGRVERQLARRSLHRRIELAAEERDLPEQVVGARRARVARQRAAPAPPRRATPSAGGSSAAPSRRAPPWNRRRRRTSSPARRARRPRRGSGCRPGRA